MDMPEAAQADSRGDSLATVQDLLAEGGGASARAVVRLLNTLVDSEVASDATPLSHAEALLLRAAAWEQLLGDGSAPARQTGSLTESADRAALEDGDSDFLSLALKDLDAALELVGAASSAVMTTLPGSASGLSASLPDDLVRRARSARERLVHATRLGYVSAANAGRRGASAAHIAPAHIREMVCFSELRLGGERSWRLRLQVLWDPHGGRLGNWCQARLSAQSPEQKETPFREYTLPVLLVGSIVRSVPVCEAAAYVEIRHNADIQLTTSSSAAFEYRISEAAGHPVGISQTTVADFVHIVMFKIVARDASEDDDAASAAAHFLVPFGSFEQVVLSGCRCLEPEMLGSGGAGSAIVCQARGVGVGGHLWRSPKVLCGHIRSRSLVDDCDVIDLGAGTGLCGLTAARLGARSVLLTDLADLCPLLRFNAELNHPASMGSEGAHAVAAASVVALAWGPGDLPLEAAAAAEASSRLVLLLSECVYNPLSDELLVETLRSLLFAGGPDAMAVLAHRILDPWGHAFFRALGPAGLAWRTEEATEISTDAFGSAETIFIVHIAAATAPWFSQERPPPPAASGTCMSLQLVPVTVTGSQDS